MGQVNDKEDSSPLRSSKASSESKFLYESYLLHDLAGKGSQFKKSIQSEVLAMKTVSKKHEFVERMNDKFTKISSAASEEQTILDITGHSSVADLAKDLFELFALFQLLCDQQFNPAKNSAKNSSSEKAVKPPTNMLGRFLRVIT